MLTVPCRPDLTNYELQCDLDGATYTLSFLWNTRESCWYFDLADAAGDIIVASVKVVVNFPLIFRVTDPRRPPGFFTAQDTTGKGRNPGIADLGDRVAFLYWEKGVDAA